MHPLLLCYIKRVAIQTFVEQHVNHIFDIMTIKNYESFNFGKGNKPKINWFPDPHGLKFSSVEIIGYELRKVSSVFTQNAKGQVINTARSVGTDKVNAQGIRESFLSKGLCTSQLPPVILETGELIDGFTRNSVLLELDDQAWFVYLVVRLKVGKTIDDAKDEIGLGLNDHLQQKPARIEDFKKRLSQWILRQEKNPSRDDCLIWFGRINHSFSSQRVANAVDDVLKQQQSALTMDSYNKARAVKTAERLLKINNVVAFDNKSGASVPRAVSDVLLRSLSEGEKPVCVGFLNGVEAENAKAAREDLKERIDSINLAANVHFRDYQRAVKKGKPYKLIDLVGFVPQIIDAEDDIIKV